jgi:hypothetical protein
MGGSKSKQQSMDLKAGESLRTASLGGAYALNEAMHQRQVGINM